MGVIYGLEIARTLGRGIDVAAWADEEGHFGSFLGSRSFCGLLTEHEIDVCANRETGVSLRDALRQAGFAGRPRQQIDTARYRGYLEAHIEQGSDLEDHHLQIGIVTAIVGIRRFRIPFKGLQNHAGTTRMAVAPGRRRGAGETRRRDRGTLSAGRRPANGLDDRRHQARSGRGQHRAGRGRDGVPVSRYRPGVLDALDAR